MSTIGTRGEVAVFRVRQLARGVNAWAEGVLVVKLENELGALGAQRSAGLGPLAGPVGQPFAV